MSKKYALLFFPSGSDPKSFEEFSNIPGLEAKRVSSIEEGVAMVATRPHGDLAVVVAKGGSDRNQLGTTLFEQLLRIHRQPAVFNIMFSHSLSTNPGMRHRLMTDPKLNVHMISHVDSDVIKALNLLAAENGDGRLSCPLCSKPHMTEHQLWWHFQMYHIGSPNVSCSQMSCPACGFKETNSALTVHYQEKHAPPDHQHDEHSSVQKLHSFSLCVIQRESDRKFLVVQEHLHKGYYFPGGAIDPGEDPATAGKRETAEEAGVEVDITGILRMEYSPARRHCRVRFIFYGNPKDATASCQPKTFPDYESMGACWVSAEEIKSLKVRHHELVKWIDYVDRGGTIHPLSLLSTEG
jgi:8-oxo-dGTP pyrophosphatase MutT (NUDIX family)